MIPSNTLIYDIETSTYGTSFDDLTKHKLKFFGAYSYKTKEYYFYTNEERDQINDLIADHKFLVGFNNKFYDNPILEYEGYDLDYKIIIDLQKIIKQRMGSIKFKGSVLTYHLKNDSLDTITKTLELTHKDTSKIKIDYSILDKEKLTMEELIEWKIYTLRDIELTKKLWEWLFNKFDSWKHHLNKYDVKKLKHITSSPSVYGYKVLCNKTGLKEEYADEKIYSDLKDGGYVSYPALEKLEGDIYCLDFASLYPHIMIQCNLFGRNKTEAKGWHGNNKFTVMGFYNQDKLSLISEALQEIYNERKQYKQNNDDREYGLKITMNIIYGLLRNNLFKNVYDDIAGNDCCILGQEWIKLAMQKYKDYGYNVFYGDTDSVYLEDVFHDKEKMLKIKEEIIKEIKDNIPFPTKTFDMDIDFEIDFIHFFKNINKKEDEDNLSEDDLKNKEELNMLKKNYLFIYNDKGEKKVFVKNLGLIKRSNTDLSKKIFWEKMAPLILLNHNAKFENIQILEWIKEYLEKDIFLLAKRISVKNKNSYKSEGCINVQVHDYIPRGEKFSLGTGHHFLIPNKRFGVGKGIGKYCTFDEYKKYLNYNDLNLNVIMKELHYFNENYIEDKMRKIKEISLATKLTQLGLW